MSKRAATLDTLDTVENTEFSLPPVAPESPVVVVVAPARCETGKAILKEWRKLYDVAVKKSGDEWQYVMGRGYQVYANHANVCPTCMEYEQARWGWLKVS